MLSDYEVQVIESWLGGNNWSPIEPYSDKLRGPHVVVVKVSSQAEADTLTSEMEALGLITDVQQLVAMSTVETALFFVGIAPTIWLGLKTANGIVKELHTSGEAIQKLISKLRTTFGGKVAVHESFSFDALTAWMKEKYGSDGYRYDPDAVQVLDAKAYTVFFVTNEVNGQSHMLAVRDGIVAGELPLDKYPDHLPTSPSRLERLERAGRKHVGQTES